MQAQYRMKVQVIRSKTQPPRFYVNIPLPLAAALDLEAGEVAAARPLEGVKAAGPAKLAETIEASRCQFPVPRPTSCSRR